MPSIISVCLTRMRWYLLLIDYNSNASCRKHIRKTFAHFRLPRIYRIVVVVGSNVGCKVIAKRKKEQIAITNIYKHKKKYGKRIEQMT